MILKKLLKTFMSCLISISPAFASNVLPAGGQVLFGKASITPVGNNMVIFSESGKNVITWDSFSVGTDNSVMFDDKNYLNIVRGSSPSIIEGKITATRPQGSFYLVNPNGITIAKTGYISAENAVLSTSKITENQVNSFVDTGNFIPSGKGMGKVKLIGKINANNLTIDGSQVIIRDISDVTYSLNNDRSHPLTNKDQERFIIKSSTGRIDIGGKKEVDLEKSYGFTADKGVISHLGETAVSTKEEFLDIAGAPDGSYFITNDINLGDISAPVVKNGTFKGKIDGAFNSISYNLRDETSSQYLGLFSVIDNASISNLKIDNSSISSKRPAATAYMGGLAGKVSSSKLANIEVHNLSLDFDSLGNEKISAGGIAGIIDTGSSISTLENIGAGFSDNTGKLIAKYSNFNYGAIAGTLNATVKTQGAIFSNAVQSGADNASAPALFGVNRTSQSFDGGSFDENIYVSFENGKSHKGFYAPFFIDEDLSFEYDKDKSYTYTDFTDNQYFTSSDYVDIAYSYDGDISDPGSYFHDYTSKPEGTQFYFVKDGKLSGTARHSINITFTPLPEKKPDTKKNVPAENRKEVKHAVSISESEDVEELHSVPEDMLHLSLNEEELNLRAGQDFQRKNRYSRKNHISVLSFYSAMKGSQPLFAETFLASLNLNGAQPQQNTEYTLASNTKDPKKKS